MVLPQDPSTRKFGTGQDGEGVLRDHGLQHRHVLAGGRAGLLHEVHRSLRHGVGVQVRKPGGQREEACGERDYKGLHAFPSDITRDGPPITRDDTPFLLILQGMALQLQGITLHPF